MKRILLLFIALAAAWGAAAKIRLPEIIGNDMVLQQNAEVRLWGWAEPHAAVKVETSWGAGAAVKSDADGRWAVSVRTPAGSYEPQRITFASGDRVTFDRVLIGEVWFAGGQSNMEMPLGGFWQCPVTDANEIIARADAKSGKLHYVKIPHAAAYTPQDRTAGSWTPARPLLRRNSPLRVTSSPKCSTTCSAFRSASSTARGAEAASKAG